MEKQTISCPAACFVVSYGYTKDARFWYDFRMRGTHKEDKIVAQAITDYVKFLADARDAVYRVNCDSRTAGSRGEPEGKGAGFFEKRGGGYHFPHRKGTQR